MRDQALNETKIEENKQKAAIVTGGNSGIGLETCYFLMKAGFQIVIGALLQLGRRNRLEIVSASL